MRSRPLRDKNLIYVLMVYAVILFVLVVTRSWGQEANVEPIGTPPAFPEVPPADSSWYGLVVEPAMNDTISGKDEFNEDIIYEEGVDSIVEIMKQEEKLDTIVLVVSALIMVLAFIIL